MKGKKLTKSDILKILVLILSLALMSLVFFQDFATNTLGLSIASGLSSMCYDSDHGANIFAKGFVTIRTIDASGRQSDYTSEDFCENGVITEYFCIGDSSQQYSYECLNGCKDNACVAKSQKPIPVCEDSDGGMDIYQTGTVTYSVNGVTSKYYDFCSIFNQKELTEQYCLLDTLKFGIITCDFGCKDGRCVKHTPDLTITVSNTAEDKDVADKLLNSINDLGYYANQTTMVDISSFDASDISRRVTIAIGNEKILFIVGQNSPSWYLDFVKEMTIAIQGAESFGYVLKDTVFSDEIDPSDIGMALS